MKLVCDDKFDLLDRVYINIDHQDQIKQTKQVTRSYGKTKLQLILLICKEFSKADNCILSLGCLTIIIVIL